MADYSDDLGSSSGGAQRRRVLTRRVVASRLSKRKANLCRYLIMLPIGVIALLAIIAQSGVAGWVLLPAIGRSINADVSAGSVTIGADGTMVLTDVVVRHPSIDGPGGQIVSIARVEASIDWASSFGGLSAVRSLRLVDPRVLVSFDSESDLTNLSGIRLPDTSGATGPTALPTIAVEDGTIEMGEHTGTQYTMLKRLNVAGSVQPDPDAGDSAYIVALYEVGRGSRTAPTGTRLTGRIDADGVEATLQGVSLSGWGPRQVPRAYRRQVAELGLRGEISSFTLRVPSQIAMSRPGGPAGASAIARVDGVELTLPLEADTAEGRLRLSNVSGRIEFRDQMLATNITGTAADVPMHITAEYDIPQGDVDLVDASFRARIGVKGYRLDRRPEFVPFLPPDVGQWLRRFAPSDGEAGELAVSPTALISSDVEIAREAPTENAPDPQVRFSGEIRFAEGSGAYHEFPYAFDDLVGTVQFNNDRIDIIEISGRAGSGAKLVVTGKISPLGEEAMVDLDLFVADVPIDEVLAAALSEDRRQTLDALFDDDLHAALIERGLILTPEQASTLRAERAELLSLGLTDERASRLVELDRRLQAPVFEYRGIGELRISLLRPEGLNSEWVRRIAVRLPRAGIVLHEFPLPIVARDVVLALTQEDAKLVGGSYHPINAIGGSLAGEAGIAHEFEPAFSFRADSMRADDLLLFAISPPDASGQPRDAGRAAAAEAVARLGLNGVFDASGEIIRRASGVIGFDADLDLSRITLAPQPYPDTPPILVSGESGVLSINESGLRLDARTTAIAVSGDESIDHPVGASIGLRLDWSDRDRGLMVDTRVDANGVLASMPVEQVVAAFAGGATPASDTMRWLRHEFKPTGRATVAAEIAMVDGKGSSVAEITDLESAEVSWLGGRLGLDDPAGAVLIKAEETAFLEAQSLTGTLRFDGETSGRVDVNGSMNLAAAVGSASRALTIDLANGAFESKLAREIARQIVGGAPAKEYLEHDAVGVFDARVSLLPLRMPPTDEEPPGINRLAFVETAIEPRSAGFTRRGASVWLDEVSGRIVSSKLRTRFESLRASGEGLSALVDGEMTPDGAGGVFVDVAMEALAGHLDETVRAVLPEPVNQQIDTLQLTTEGEVRLTDGRLRVRSRPIEGDLPEVAYTFDGTIEAENGAAIIGTPIDKITGSAAVHAAFTPGRPAATVRLHAKADRARVMGIWLEDALLRLEGDGIEPGRIVVPHVSATVAGGLLSGHSALHPVSSGSSDPASSYQIDLRFADMNLARLREQLDASKAGVSEFDELPAWTSHSGAHVDGSVQLAGIVGQDDTRRGRGSFDIAGGRVVETPSLLRLVELVNLQVPGAADLDYAHVDFVADGPFVQINELTLISESVQLFGFGTVRIPELEFDLRFLSRGAKRYPLVDAVLNMLRDELFTTRISGTVGDLRTSSELAPETRRIVGGALTTGNADWATAVGKLRKRAEDRIGRQRAAEQIRGQVRGQVRGQARPSQRGPEQLGHAEPANPEPASSDRVADAVPGSR